MAINPFEPPRTRDLDADPAGPSTTVSAEAIAELVRSAPWVRAVVWMMGASLVFGLFGLVFAVVRPRTPTNTAGNILVQVGGLVVSLAFLAIYIGYRQRLDRLARGETAALPEVIDSQRRLFKTMGILILVSIPITLIAIVVGVVAARATGAGAP
jgi:hypothetical protein